MRGGLHLSDALHVCRHSPGHLQQIEYLGSTIIHRSKVFFGSYSLDVGTNMDTYSHLLGFSQPGRKNLICMIIGVKILAFWSDGQIDVDRWIHAKLVKVLIRDWVKKS